MTGRDELALIAELGAAYAGFLAIFLIFARREGRFSPADSLAIRSMILGSFSAVFIALFPIVLGTFDLSEAIVWRVASGFGLLVLLPVGASMGLAQRRLSPSEKIELGSLPIAAWILVFAITTLFLSNVFAIFGDPSAGPHIGGLVVMLAITTLNFADIAFKRLI